MRLLLHTGSSWLITVEICVVVEVVKAREIVPCKIQPNLKLLVFLLLQVLASVIGWQQGSSARVWEWGKNILLAVCQRCIPDTFFYQWSVRFLGADPFPPPLCMKCVALGCCCSCLACICVPAKLPFCKCFTLGYARREPFLTRRTRKLALPWEAVIPFSCCVWHLGTAVMGGL